MKTLKSLLVIAVFFVCLTARAQTEATKVPKLEGEIVVLIYTLKVSNNVDVHISDNKGSKSDFEIKIKSSESAETLAKTIGDIVIQGYKLVGTSTLGIDNTYIFRKE
jgi:hypothetical protein